MGIFDKDYLLIKSQTTGFSSPAETYVDKRLDLNELIVDDLYSTFYFRYSGPNIEDIKTGDTLVIDRNKKLKTGDLIIIVEDGVFKIKRYEDQINIWGTITWILKKV